MNTQNADPEDQAVDDDGSSDLLPTRKSQSYNSFDTGYLPSVTLDEALFQKFRQKALSYRENVAAILEEHGNETLFDYVTSYTKENPNKLLKPRREELISVFQKQVQKTLGSSIAASVAKQLKTNHSVSTCQKTNPLSNPYTLNATLENSLPYFAGGNNPSLQNIIVLACANVSFNNWNYPKGHLFHSFTEEKMFTNLLPFFGHAYDSRPVIFHKSYEQDAIIDTKGRLEQLRREGAIGKKEIDRIKVLVDEIYASPHAMSMDTYVDQLTVTNYYFFKKLFSGYKKFTPNLIFLSQEMITLQLLSEYHLKQDTIINKIIFDDRLEQLIYKHLEGIRGTFDRSREYGTYLFWGISKDRKLKLKLWREGNFLVSKDGSFKLELTPEAIADAIADNSLIPSLFLVFATLGFYYGLQVSGGYVQTMYLTQMKERYQAMLREYGMEEESQMAETVATKNFVIAFPSIAFLQSPGDYRVPATGLDFALYGQGGRYWPEVLQATKSTTLNELVNRVLPSYYREFCPDTEKDESLAQITEADIEKFTGLDKKVPTIATAKDIL